MPAEGCSENATYPTHRQVRYSVAHMQLNRTGLFWAMKIPINTFQHKPNMQSPYIFPLDSDHLSLDLWDGTDSFLNPCYKPDKLELSVNHHNFSKEDNISESVTSRIPHSVNRRDSNIIILIGLIGVLLFLMFIVNLLIWAKRRNKVRQPFRATLLISCFEVQGRIQECGGPGQGFLWGPPHSLSKDCSCIMTASQKKQLTDGQ